MSDTIDVDSKCPLSQDNIKNLVRREYQPDRVSFHVYMHFP